MRKALIVFILFIALSLCGMLWLFKSSISSEPNLTSINDAVITAMQSDDKNTASKLVITELLHEVDRMDANKRSRDLGLQVFLSIYMGVLASAGLYLYLYCERSVLKPFRKLRQFARNVAAGNLDIPLEMDRYGSFGAFTESFDLMREELSSARENERKADRSKKELVASLSHDIKTPVASIKAVTEYMLLMEKEDDNRKQLELINAKAEQINSLITNMFHAALEELQELSVTADEIQSTAIPNLIYNADYKKRVKAFSIPNCIISSDLLRLQQVFDNIISNSYKYADTDIEINSFIEEHYLVISITDFGTGVSEDELPLLSGKFYRGKNADAKSGYGLGLYISKCLLEQMSGDLRCENRSDGFSVQLMLWLAG